MCTWLTARACSGPSSLEIRQPGCSRSRRTTRAGPSLVTSISSPKGEQSTRAGTMEPGSGASSSDVRAGPTVASRSRRTRRRSEGSTSTEDGE